MEIIEYVPLYRMVHVNHPGKWLRMGINPSTRSVGQTAVADPMLADLFDEVSADRFIEKYSDFSKELITFN